MIKQLVNIGSIKPTGDQKKDILNLAKQIQKEFDYLRGSLNPILSKIPQSPAQNTTTIVSASNDAPAASADVSSKAGIVAITSVADTFISFVGTAMSGPYVLSAFFLDASGQFANIPVLQTDLASNGFMAREKNIPGVGTLFYMAILTN